MNYDCVIIGAGMSGLAAGIRLAMFDKKVCIVEKHYTAGGLNSYYSKGGRLFDVGLHAMTNYVAKGHRGAPLTRLLKQLRIPHEALGLEEQIQSRISFPSHKILFSNDFALMQAEVAAQFPAEIDNFNRLLEYVKGYDDLVLEREAEATRPVLQRFIKDPLLIEMLLCPLMYYGSARENEIDFHQFVILFKAIYLEGFSRPEEGVRRIIKLLLNRYKELGGEIRLKTAVDSIVFQDERLAAVKLVDGEDLATDRVISSVGLVETSLLCGEKFEDHADNIGRLSFMESITTLDCLPADLGHEDTIVFYNDSEQFHYQVPTTPIDSRSGVICCPNNYQNHELDEGMIRVTNIANPDFWLNHTDEETYSQAKQDCYNESIEYIAKLIPDFRSHATYIDIFTPRTILKYTGHLRGAVYGAPEKSKTGMTAFDKVFVCGTDQGFLGIVGAMLSGITIANNYGLMDNG